MKIYDKWFDHEFETACNRTPEYLAWHRDFRNTLKKMLPEGAELIMSKPNHFDASGFIRRGETFVYFSVSDIRFFKNAWYRAILIRTAKGLKDYTGGANNHTTLPDFTANVDRLLKQQEVPFYV